MIYYARMPYINLGRPFEHAGLQRLTVEVSWGTVESLRIASYGMFVPVEETEAAFEDRRRRILADIDALAVALLERRNLIAGMPYPGIPEQGSITVPSLLTEGDKNG